MAAGDLVVFNQGKEWLGNLFTMDSDTWTVAILNNTVTPTPTTPNPGLGTFNQSTTQEGPQVLGGITWDELGGTVTFNSTTNPTWVQNPGNSSDAFWALIYADNLAAPVADPAIAYVDLDGPVDLAAGALTINWNVAGIITLT